MTAEAGAVMTVLGPISADALGRTLMHEHLLFDLETYLHQPPDPADAPLVEAPLALDTLWWVREHPMASRHNLSQRDPSLAAAEAARFRAAGGSTIVEVSSIGLSRDVHGLRAIAERTGLNIVAGTGYYVGSSHPASLAGRSVEAVTDELVRDLDVGLDGTTIRAGVIGEIGTSEPLYETEILVLRAAARAQALTGAPMVVHPAPQHLNADAMGRWLDILEREGADPARVVISHLEARLGQRPEDFHVLAKRGYQLSLDTWGNTKHYESRNFSMPSDPDRVKLLTRLVAEGLASSLVLAQDICYRDALTAYGGPGYGYILRHMAPRLLAAGVPQVALDTMLVDNPRRILPRG
ncbi:MAG: phosphotriesterase-related protein [Chloroflexi bacterium]|nr:phosphotriesterase-related protein [Chloroflexota bacterium]